MIHITDCQYRMVSERQVAIVAEYELEASNGTRVKFEYANNLLGGPYTYEALQMAIDDYAGSLARNGYDHGLAQELAALRGAMDFIKDHAAVGDAAGGAT